MTVTYSAQGVGDHTICYYSPIANLRLRASNEEDREPLAVNVSCHWIRLQLRPQSLNRHHVFSRRRRSSSPPRAAVTRSVTPLFRGGVFWRNVRTFASGTLECTVVMILEWGVSPTLCCDVRTVNTLVLK
ncbi:hypothetical protein ANCDUO_07837 [Ancylostoma duodenale]|uniref:Uncharacterized protein n=1 Tax=Ancylostoma duodenale TaxID=51022 RepID=A0A0C2GL14_9BILA|nr:hypothetical protein ANCDUO_07837 [Ancylostoma duodenale]